MPRKSADADGQIPLNGLNGVELPVPTVKKRRTVRAPGETETATTRCLRYFCDQFKLRHGTEYLPEYRKDSSIMKRMIENWGEGTVHNLITKFFEASHHDLRILRSGHDVPALKINVNYLNARRDGTTANERNVRAVQEATQPRH